MTPFEAKSLQKVAYKFMWELNPWEYIIIGYLLFNFASLAFAMTCIFYPFIRDPKLALSKTLGI